MTPEQQVLAAVRAYYEALNVAGASGDTTQLAMLSTPDCSCRQVIAYLQELRAKGQRLRNARDDISKINVQRVGPDFATVLVHYTSPTHEVIAEADGTVLDSFPARKVAVQLALKSVTGRWLIAVARELS